MANFVTSPYIFQTRVQLKYDTYENWTTNNPILLAGEVAIATVDSTDGNKSATRFQNLPNVVIKVGDGTNRYNTLKFVSGLAADVYEWAKADTKPTYTASEIGGLKTFIEENSDYDTDTQYTIEAVADSTYKFELKYKGLTDSAFKSFDTPVYIDLTEVNTRLNSAEAAITKLNGASDVEGSVANSIEKAIDKLDYNVAGIANAADSTIDVLKEENGVISASYKKIAITHDQVTDWATAVKPIEDEIGELEGRVEVLEGEMDDVQEFITGYPDDVNDRINTAIGKLNATEVAGSQSGSSISFINKVSESAGIVSADVASVELTGIYDAETNKIATQDYVKQQVADLTGAMHFIGESTTDPAEGTVTVDGEAYTGVAGDIVIFEAKEYICDKNGDWIELGDEGSAAAQIAKLNANVANNEGAAYTVASVVQASGVLTEVKTQKIQIAMDQVTGLSDEFSGVSDRIKAVEDDVADHEERIVDLEETAAALDTTIGDKINAAIDKLDKADAEVEGQYVSAVSEENGIITVSRKALPTIPNLDLEDGGDADVSGNTVEVVASISVDGHKITHKDATVVTEAGLTARVNALASTVDAQSNSIAPEDATTIKVLTKVVEENGVLVESKSEAVELHKVAKSGNVDDLDQTADTYFVLNCGSSSVNI